MTEQTENIPKRSDPVYTKQSQFALVIFNQEIQRYVTLKSNVAYLRKMELQTNHAQWKDIHAALTQKCLELKDCKVSVRSCKELYEEILAAEQKGEFLD